MRAAAIVLVAIIGFVNSQNFGNHGVGGQNYPDQARPMGASQQRRNDWGGNNPLNGGFQHGGYQNPGMVGGARQQQQPGQNYPDQARPMGASQQNRNDFGGNNPLNGGFHNPGMTGGARQQQQPGSNNGLNQVNAGAAPVAGGSSGGVMRDYPQFVNSGPATSNVQHVNAGAQPQGTGGSSGLQDVPLGPVQTGMNNNVNMNNAGTGPLRGEGNSPNSGEFAYDYGVGAPINRGQQTGFNNNAMPNNQPGQPQRAGETVLGQPGGQSGQYNNAVPLGGAQISDFTQKEAGNSAHSTGAASFGGTAAGVVVAVLVLVGIVGVAAVFLIKQRRSRMTMAQV